MYSRTLFFLPALQGALPAHNLGLHPASNADPHSHFLTESRFKNSPFCLRASANETLKRTPILAGMKVLHLGCGNGFLLERLASYTGVQLFGLEPVIETMALAKTSLPSSVRVDHGFDNNIPHPDNYFDIVISCNTLHKMRSQESVLHEISRVLRPGGRVVITDWCDDYLGCRLCDCYLRFTRNKNHCKTYSQTTITNLLSSGGFIEPLSEHYEIKWTWGLFTAQARKPA